MAGIKEWLKVTFCIFKENIYFAQRATENYVQVKVYEVHEIYVHLTCLTNKSFFILFSHL